MNDFLVKKRIFSILLEKILKNYTKMLCYLFSVKSVKLNMANLNYRFKFNTLLLILGRQNDKKNSA